jgi:very-short-patch-repair endonuclease
MSLPEVMLWQALRKKQSGLRFRKQHPAGPYVLDFYCDAVKVCVEVEMERATLGGWSVIRCEIDGWPSGE